MAKSQGFEPIILTTGDYQAPEFFLTQSGQNP